MKPRFITLDGIDGAGKSTNLAVMKAWFEKHKLPVLFTREPGGTPAGEALREILLNPATQVSLRTETLLMFAARQQHLETVILPALKKRHACRFRPLYRCNVCLSRRRARRSLARYCHA